MAHPECIPATALQLFPGACYFPCLSSGRFYMPCAAKQALKRWNWFSLNLCMLFCDLSLKMHPKCSVLQRAAVCTTTSLKIVLAVATRNVHFNTQLKIALFGLKHSPLPGINFHGAEALEILLFFFMMAAD